MDYLHGPGESSAWRGRSLCEEGLGEVVIPGVVPTLSETPGRIANLGPPLGNATYEILRELLDIPAQEIRRLRQRRII